MTVHKKIVAMALGIILMAGCASTKMTSFRDPDFVGKSYGKILVFVPFSDLDSRMRSETIFSKSLRSYAIDAVPSLDVLTPTRTYNDGNELIKILTDNKIEAVLVTTLTDAYSSQTYIPESSSTSGRGNISGNTLTFSSQTQHYGGYYVSKPRVRYEIKLLDVATGKVAWMATSFTKGNAFANFDKLMRSLAKTTTVKLSQDGLLNMPVINKEN